MHTTAKDLNLWTRDPLLSLLKTRLGFSDLAITLILSATVAIFYYGIPALASALGDTPPLRATFGDTASIFFALGYVLIVAPAIFSAYTQSPSAVLDTLYTIEETTGISDPDSPFTAAQRQQYTQFLIKLKTTVDRTAWTLLAFVFSIVLFVLLSRLGVPGTDPTPLAQLRFTIDDQTVLFAASLQFLLFFYAMSMYAIKSVASLWCYRRFFPIA